MTENLKLEVLEKSKHSRAKALLNWVKYNKENLDWYLEYAWKDILLVQNWINILWNTWKLNDEKISKEADKWIFHINWKVYFTFDVQKELFWDNVPKKEDWENLTNFLPWNDENKFNFLQKVLWISMNGYLDTECWALTCPEQMANYWSSTSVEFPTAYFMSDLGNNPVSSDGTFRNYGLNVRCFKKK